MKSTNSPAGLQRVVDHLCRAAALLQDAEQLGDQELLARFVSERDESAFSALLGRHGPMVLGVCRRVLHRHCDAEDAFQATFLILAHRAGSIRKRQALGSWLYGVAHRVAVRAKANAASRRVHEQRSQPMPQPDPADAAANTELHALVDQELMQLPEACRAALVLCYLEGKTQDSAAQHLGCSKATLRRRLDKARELLRLRLVRRGMTLSAALAGSLLAPSAVPAAVPAKLASATVGAALGVAAGQSVVGLVSAQVAALVKGGLQAMVASKVKTVIAVVLAVSLTAGAGVASRAILSAREGSDKVSDTAPQNQAAPKPATPRDNTASTPKGAQKEIPGEQVVVSGRVLDPEGKPLAGAHLYWPRLLKEMPKSLADIAFPECGVSAADGGFKVDLEWPRGPLAARPYLVARAEGYGIDWAELSKAGKLGDVTLRLVKDSPIRGRVLNTEGKPLAGVRVGVGSVMANADGRLDKFLTAWKGEWELAIQAMSKHAYLPPGKVLPSATTDKDGQFELAGAGAEHVVLLDVSGPAVAQATLYVVNRPGVNLKAINQAAQDRESARTRIPGQPPLLYGPSFDYVASPGRVIEGLVREAGSGKALAGIAISARGGYNSGVQGVSDDQGRFRLAGLPKMKEYSLICEPSSKGPWLRRIAVVPDVEGLQPIKYDIELVRGILVTGRVIDKATGKGVQSGVRFAPLPDNKFFGKKPGYDSCRRDRLMTTTDAEGRFRLVAMPGTGVLMAQVNGRADMFGGLPVRLYKQADFDVEDRKHVPVTGTGDDRYFPTAAGIETLAIQNAVKRVDLAETSGPVTCDLFLDAGKTLTVHIQDGEGKPLSGAMISGMTASWPITFPLKDSSCTVYALDPSKPRRLVFFHGGRKLAGSLTVRGDEKEDPVVRLAATATIRGRLLDSDGQPLAGVLVQLSSHDQIASELYRQLDTQREPARSDKDGLFGLDGVVPEVQFALVLRKGRHLLVLTQRLKVSQVASAKTLDLGDLATKPFQP